jgi:glycosyltransferase involved in cell wall biosynthesis
LRVIHIINDLNTGGAEIQLLKVLRKSPSNQEVLVISLKQVGEIGNKIKKLKIPLIALGINRYNFIHKIVILVTLIKKFNPCVVHTWMYHSNLIGGIAAKFSLKAKIIWSIHHNDLSPELNKRSTIIIARLGALFSFIVPNSIICVSENVLETHSKFGYDSKKLTVIYNGIDTEEFYFIPEGREKLIKELDLNKEDLLIGFFARFDPIKNWKGFLKACEILSKNKNMNSFKIIIGGAGMDNGNIELKRFIDSHKLKNYVYLLGPRDDMPDLLSSMDVVVNSSFNESFSLILAESMACQVLCISTIVGDPCNIVGNYGIRKNFNSSEELSNEIYMFLNQPKHLIQKDRKLARERIINDFDLGKTVYKYSLLYN